MKNITIVCLFIVFLTSSMDRFLNIVIAGFNVRAAYFIIGFLGLLFIIKTIVNCGKIEKNYFSGWKWLLLWTFTLILFVPNTTFLMRNIGYILWHLVHVFCIFIIINSISDLEKFNKAIRLYLFSFVLLAGFGILQFLFGLIGIPLLITDWWIINKFPRVNGFCYEPSYFGTFLLLGWSCFFVMKINKNDVFTAKELNYAFLIVTLGTVVTSSRMTYLIIISTLFLYAIFMCSYDFLRLRISKKTLIFIISLSACSIVLTSVIVKNIDSIRFLFNGIGLAGASAGSVGQRSNETKETFEIFLSSPYVGVSLGGIPSARALKKGIIVNDNITAKKYEGLNIFIEILAASGIFGFCFFLFYLLAVFYESLKWSKKLNHFDRNMKVVILSLCFGLLTELVVLMMNQNVSRLYLWVHIGLLTSAICIAKKRYKLETNLSKPSKSLLPIFSNNQ